MEFRTLYQKVPQILSSAVNGRVERELGRESGRGKLLCITVKCPC